MNRITFRYGIMAMVFAAIAAATPVTYTDHMDFGPAHSPSTFAVWLNFRGLESGSVIPADQYAGVTLDGDDTAAFAAALPAFQQDDYGAGGGANGVITLMFAQPMAWLGVDYLFRIRVTLYSGEELVWDSGHIIVADYYESYGAAFFGVVGAPQFDRAVLSAAGQVVVDDVGAGAQTVQNPEPATWLMLGSALVVLGWRRVRR